MPINDIKQLLTRWYAGETSPEEEARLDALLAGSVPPELEEDANLFRALREVKTAMVEIPDPIAKRINFAVNAEIGRNRRNRSPLFDSRRFRIAAAAAVGLILAASALWFVNDNDETRLPEFAQTVNAADTIKPTLAPPIDRNMIAEASTTGPSESKVSSSINEVNESSKSRSNSIKGETRAQKTSITDVSVSDPETADHTEKYPRPVGNYRIIDNTEEANAIVNSIFSRLDDAIAMTTSQIASARLDFEVELAKISEIENKTLRYEQSPI